MNMGGALGRCLKLCFLCFNPQLTWKCWAPSGYWYPPYPCRKYSCRSRWGSGFYRDWAVYCVKSCPSTKPTLSFGHCYKSTCPHNFHATSSGKYCNGNTRPILSYPASCPYENTAPAIGLSGAGCYTVCGRWIIHWHQRIISFAFLSKSDRTTYQWIHIFFWLLCSWPAPDNNRATKRDGYFRRCVPWSK